jgi:Fe-coproporphyrin III synthase
VASQIFYERCLYITLLSKYARIRLFHGKRPLCGSVDVNNICNLHCTHCYYWWLNRKEEEEERDLSAEQWRQIIKRSFKKREHIFLVTFVGESLCFDLTSLKCFAEMPKRVCVVTNGTIPLKRYDGLYFTGSK